jgi:hypothetical protein
MSTDPCDARRHQTFLFLVVFFALSVVPMAAAASDPRQVLAAARAASGGAAWNQVKSLQIHSTSPTGPVEELDDVETGRYITRGTNEADGFDGISVWTQGNSGVGYVLGDDNAQFGAVDQSFRVARGWWFPTRRPATIEDGGVQQDGDQTFDTVRITPEGGRPFTLWIDQKTHLVDRDIERSEERTITTHFSDYRRVGDLLLPFTVKSDLTGTQTVQHVEVNVPFAQTAFALPPVPVLEIAQKPVTVPFRLKNGKILIQITMNGQGPFDCTFDTGGSLLLPPDMVKRLALHTQGGDVATGGGEGSIAASHGVVQSFAIGGIPLGQQAFDSFETRRPLAGLEILQRYVVRIDFDRMQMTFTPPENFHYRGSGTIIPFHFQDNQPEVIGSVDGIAAKFAIDTGDTGSLLLIAPFAQRYHLLDKYGTRIPYGGTSVTATHGFFTAQRASEIRFDGIDGRAAESVSHPVTRISTQETGFDANQYVSGNIGIGILKQFNITFDYSRHQLILERNHSYGQPDVFDESGLASTSSDDTGWHVRAVYDGSPAANAGIHAGDVITRINGKTPRDLDMPRGSFDEHWDMLRNGPPGSTLQLEVKNADGTTRLVTITLKDIL